MEFKGTKGKWKIEYLCDENSIRASLNKGLIDVWTDMNEVTIEEANANALLISKALEFIEETQDTIDELKLLKSTILEASKTNNKLESVVEVIQNWIDRKEQLIKEATEL